MYLINQLVKFNPDNKSLVNCQTGRAIQLQPPASLYFLYLITHANDIVSQNTLMTIGWGERNSVTTINTLYQAILALRNAPTDVGLPRDTVKTISQRGFRLNEDTQVETITFQQSEVSLSPVIERIPPARITLSTLQQTTQIPWLEVLFGASVVITTLIIWLVWYQTCPVMPFSKFVQASMQTPLQQNYKIYYSSNEHDQQGYFNLMQLHPYLCENNKCVFLIGYSKAERIVTFVCDKDVRVDINALYTTHYYWIRGQWEKYATL